MKSRNSLIVGILMATAFLGYACGNGSTESSGTGAQSFDNDTFSVSPSTPVPGRVVQELPVIADPITTDNKLVVKCEPNSTTTLGDYVGAICKLSSPQANIRFTCLNGKVQGYLPSINCERLTLDCNQSGFSQDRCEETIQD